MLQFFQSIFQLFFLHKKFLVLLRSQSLPCAEIRLKHTRLLNNRHVSCSMYESGMVFSLQLLVVIYVLKIDKVFLCGTDQSFKFDFIDDTSTAGNDKLIELKNLPSTRNLRHFPSMVATT